MARCRASRCAARVRDAVPLAGKLAAGPRGGHGGTSRAGAGPSQQGTCGRRVNAEASGKARAHSGAKKRRARRAAAPAVCPLAAGRRRVAAREYPSRKCVCVCARARMCMCMCSCGCKCV